MNLQNIKNINQYNSFILSLNPNGPFQIRFIAFNIILWSLSGLLRAVYQKNVFYNYLQQLPLASVSTIIGLFLNTYLSLYYGRKIINIAFSIILFLGSTLLIIQLFVLSQSVYFAQIGLYLISLSHYTICLSWLCILCQYLQPKALPLLVWGSLFSFHLSKAIWVIPLQNLTTQGDKFVISFIMFTVGVFFVLINFFHDESLRYFLETDINKAENLASKISQKNDCACQKIMNIMQESFIWKKINIKRYGIATLWQNKSLSGQTYYMGFSFLLLGIIGKLPVAIFQLNQTSKSIDFKSYIQLLWIGIFQTVGFIPCVFAYKLFNRKSICIAIAIVSCILNFFFLVLNEIAPIMNTITYSCLGLNAFCSIVIFYFMILQCIQYYPHTIRTFGCGICFVSYYLGQMIFNLHIYFIEDEGSILEMIFCCSILLIAHLTKIQETLGKSLKYEIAQIEEQQYLQD